MFATFVQQLRSAGLPVSITEYLALMGAMKANIAAYDIDDFYFLARATLVKDERHLDRFDRVFATVFQGLEHPPGDPATDIPTSGCARSPRRISRRRRWRPSRQWAVSKS